MPIRRFFSHVCREFQASEEMSISKEEGQGIFIDSKNLVCHIAPLNGLGDIWHGWYIYTSNTPPSINRTYSTTKRGGFYKNKEAQAWGTWIRSLAMGAKRHSDMVWDEHIHLISMLFWFVPSNCDVDNSTKIIHDSFEGVFYPNDRRIDVTLNGKATVRRRKKAPYNKGIFILFAPIEEFDPVNTLFARMVQTLTPVLFPEVPSGISAIFSTPGFFPDSHIFPPDLGEGFPL